MKTILCWLTVISLVSMISFKARSEEAVTTTTTSTVKTTDTTMTFTPDERRIIREKVTITKKPATQTTTVTKIVRGETLPVAVYQTAAPVDSKILVELPKQPESTKLVVIDDKVVRISEPSHQVLDVFDLDDIQDKIEENR